MEATQRLKKAVNEYKNGKAEAFNVLYEESSKYIYACIYKVMQGNDNAQDICCDMMQDTYVEISKSIEQLEDAARFLSWAGTIATRKCYAYLKKNKKYVLLAEEDNTFDNLSDSEAIIPEEVMQDKEKQRLLRDIINNELTEMQRLCIIGYYYNEQKQSEIAQELGIPENTVKTNLSRAKAKIKEGVLDLEKKKGTKLYSVAPVLLLLFKEDIKAALVPEQVTSSVFSAVSAGAATAGTTSAASAGTAGATTATSAGTAGAAATVAKVGFFAKLAAAALPVKIVTGVVAVAAVGTIGVAAAQGVASKEDGNQEIVSETVENSLEGDVDTLLNDSQNEVTNEVRDNSQPDVSQPDAGQPDNSQQETPQPAEPQTVELTEEEKIAFGALVQFMTATRWGEDINGQTITPTPENVCTFINRMTDENLCCNDDRYTQYLPESTQDELYGVSYTAESIKAYAFYSFGVEIADLDAVWNWKEGDKYLPLIAQFPSGDSIEVSHMVVEGTTCTVYGTVIWGSYEDLDLEGGGITYYGSHEFTMQVERDENSPFGYKLLGITYSSVDAE